MNLEHFIVNSESIGIQGDIKLVRPTILLCTLISQKEQRHQANSSLRATCTLVRVKMKGNYSNEAPPPVET
jgi:hypothetical protein